MPFKIHNVESSPDGISRSLLPHEGADRYDPFIAWHERAPVRDEASGATIGVEDDPQRGFETFDYRFTPERHHPRSQDRAGFIWAGGMAWMRAGSDHIEAQSPAEQPLANAAAMRAFEICLNVPRGETSTRPRHRAFDADALPVARARGSWVRVLAGEFAGERSPVVNAYPLFMVHVRLTPRADVAFPLELGATTLVYAMRGTAQLGPQAIEAGQIATSRRERSYIALEGGADGFEGFVLSAIPVGETAGAKDQYSINSPQEAPTRDAADRAEGLAAVARAD